MHPILWFAFSATLTWLLGWQTVAAAPPPCLIRLTDVTQETGITFRHTHGGSGLRYIIEYIASGLALLDYDHDGDVDIYFLSGAPLKGTKMDVQPHNTLYRNDGNFHFTDVTKEAGVGDVGHSLGVAAADYDNDGDIDLYVNNFGPNVLYRNNGNGTFTNVAKEAGVANGNKVGAGVCFLDIDKDGLLDIYVANYVRFSYDTHKVHYRNGLPSCPTPLEYEGDPDTVFRNQGDGTFKDVSRESGVAAHPGTGMGMVCADYDNDGDTDVLVGNDVLTNFLFQNDGTGKFEEVGIFSGTALDANGNPHGSMGVGCGDYDNDGLLDFYITSYGREWATLYRNLGDGIFADVTRVSNAGRGTFPHVTWGNGFIDLENDGDQDLFIACGHLDDNIELRDDTTTYRTPNILQMNTGNGKFVNVSTVCGNGMLVKESSRGVGFDDLDNDGDVDIVILNSCARPTILRNDSKTDNHWLQIRLQGTKANRSAIGSHVRVVAGDLDQMNEVHSGRGYQSHWGDRLYFGLGKQKKVDRIEVRWLGGGTDTLRDVPVDQVIRIVEGGSNE